MRELKFRAWDKKENVMKSPATIHQLIDMAIPCHVAFDYEFMQFTGLRDKNGVEIYEGDIVAFYVRASFEPDSRPVKNTKGQVVICSTETSFGCWSASYCHSITIIGNIHQNPELLK